MEHGAEPEPQPSNSQLLLFNFRLTLSAGSTLLGVTPVETSYPYPGAEASSHSPSGNYADNTSCLRAKNASNHDTPALEMGCEYPNTWVTLTVYEARWVLKSRKTFMQSVC